jgi:ADP-ribosylarginine hydrolase
MGFLGCLVTALFCSYAIRNIEPWKWGKMLIELNNSGKIDKYIEKIGIKNKYDNDKHKFWDFWYDYVEQRLPKFYIKPKEFMFSSNRVSDLLLYMPDVILKNNQANFSKLGATGCGATILAYDSLLCSINMKRKVESFDKIKMDDVNFSWQNLVYFSTLHFGDNDSTGIIAGSWYGALKGFEGFDKKKINELEFKKELLNF